MAPSQALLGSPGSTAPWYAGVPGINSPEAKAAITVKGSMIVVLPQKLIDFECHKTPDPSSPAVVKGDGRWCGPPGCVDMGAGGFGVVHQWVPEGEGVACLLAKAQ